MSDARPLRKLIVNADDFGFTHDVNEGVVEAHRKGILRAATLMANGAAFEDAVHLARENPDLDVGCHLVLVGGASVLDPRRMLPATTGELIESLALRRLRPFEELAAQTRKILESGLRPTHLDTHKHTHLLPPVLEAVARISEEFGIRWVRLPFDFPRRGAARGVPWTRRAASRGLRLFRRRMRTVLERHGCRATDHFAGFQITGLFRAPELAALIRDLPPGVTELMCHPGRCREELRRARTRLKESRERELEALVAGETREAAVEAGVEIVSFRQA